MKQLNTYGDERELAFCAFCGGETGTRDHCPSRVFLDEPYPENLPVVPACQDCNIAFSMDEEYLACMVTCVIAGTTDPEYISRPKIRRIISSKPALRARIENGRTESAGQIIFTPEDHRVRNVITKLARGHALFELHMPCQEEPDIVNIFPLLTLNETALYEFEHPSASMLIWPEVGSRAMQRLVGIGAESPSGWLEVQPGNYRYHASVSAGAVIRLVIGEYLGAYIEWAG